MEFPKGGFPCLGASFSKSSKSRTPQASAFGGSDRLLCPLADPTSFLLGEVRLEVNHEPILRRPIDGDKVNIQFHQPRDEVDEPVKFCDHERRPTLAAEDQYLLQLRTVGRLPPRLGVGELGDDRAGVAGNT